MIKKKLANKKGGINMLALFHFEPYTYTQRGFKLLIFKVFQKTHL